MQHYEYISSTISITPAWYFILKTSFCVTKELYVQKVQKVEFLRMGRHFSANLMSFFKIAKTIQ